eukprot:jgi/Psemu1/197762/e_gw1.209.25.1
MAWCLGEYAYLSAVVSLDEILTKLCQWNKSILHPSTRRFLTSAIFKLVAQVGTCPPQAAVVVDEYTRSKDLDLQQRCLEFQSLLMTAPQYLGEILPVDASAEDIEVDSNLTFLDGFCQQALANGARPYEKPEDDDDEDYDYGASGSGSGSGGGAFNLTPYAKPETNVNRSAMMARGVGGGPQGAISSPAGVSLPPGSSSGTQAQVSTSVDVVGDGLSLNTRGAANVWGKKPAAPPAPAAPAPAAPAPEPTPSPTSNAFGGGYSSSYGGAGAFGQTSVPAPVMPEKTPEQLEKERQAAALFGGMIPGQPPPVPRAAPPPPPVPRAMPPAAPPVAAAPPPAAPPAAAPEFDLLDFGGTDVVSAPAPASLANDLVDIFGTAALEPTPAAPPPAAPVPAAAAPIVETVSDDEVEAPPAPAPAPADPVDPFAAEGLLGDLQTPTLHGFGVSTARFEFNGSPMAPLKITTPQFGQHWGSCTATSPVSVNSRKVVSLNLFMKECENVGLHPIEAIHATNEGICGGMFDGGSKIILVHGKVSPLATGETNLSITVKSADPTLSGSLALYLQNMMK